jgi:outer membrane murein-binding lipoprotein Lpp
MPEQSGDYLSRLQEYGQRLDGLMDEARAGIERQAPEILDRMAATARNLAQRLDDLARDARQRRAEEHAATPESGAAPDRAPEPPREPPPPSGPSGTPGT